MPPGTKRTFIKFQHQTIIGLQVREGDTIASKVNSLFAEYKSTRLRGQFCEMPACEGPLCARKVVLDRMPPRLMLSLDWSRDEQGASGPLIEDVRIQYLWCDPEGSLNKVMRREARYTVRAVAMNTRSHYYTYWKDDSRVRYQKYDGLADAGRLRDVSKVEMARVKGCPALLVLEQVADVFTDQDLGSGGEELDVWSESAGKSNSGSERESVAESEGDVETQPMAIRDSDAGSEDGAELCDG